jgi:nitrilase
MSQPAYKVAAAHVAPVFLNLEATVEKTCSIIREAARNGAQLVVFPETFLPAFPVWLSLRAPIHNHDLFCELAANTMRADGPQMARIAGTARECGIFVSVGFNEGVDSSVGTIFNSNALIGDDGRVLNHHRKIVPTFYEKLVWAPGDGAGLRVVETRLGRLGMLICGENTNPLARYSLIAQGEQVHWATWPPIWPTHDPDRLGNYSLEEGIKIRGGAHAFEGKLFNIVVSAWLDKAAFDRLATLDKDAARILEGSPCGVSAVFGPSGLPVTKIHQTGEELIYADIDLNKGVELKQLHDISGGYNRFDIFQLKVNRAAQRPVEFETAPPAPDQSTG